MGGWRDTVRLPGAPAPAAPKSWRDTVQQPQSPLAEAWAHPIQPNSQDFQPTEEMPVQRTPAQAVTTLAGMAGGGLVDTAGLAGYLGRQGVNAAAGAFNGYNNAPEGGKMSGALKGAGIAAGLGTAAEGVAAAAPPAADYLMQKAVGMRQFLSGAGTRLLDMVGPGTKSAMKQAIDAAGPGAEAAVQDAASKVSPADPQELANLIKGRASAHVTPDSGDMYNPAIPATIAAKAEHIAAMGGAEAGSPAITTTRTSSILDASGRPIEQTVTTPATAPVQGKLTGADLVSLKRQAEGEAGYSAAGTPLQTAEGGMGRATGNWAREKLGPETGEALANQQALVLGSKALSRPTNPQQGLPLTTLAAGMAGSKGGLIPAIADAATAQLARTPLATSMAAYGAKNLVTPAAKALRSGAGTTLYNAFFGGQSGNGQ